MKSINSHKELEIGYTIKLNHDGISYLYDIGFKTIPSNIKVTNIVTIDDDFYVESDDIFGVKIAIGEIESFTKNEV